MIADSHRKAPQSTATLSALQFQTPNLVPKVSMSINLSGHGQNVRILATLGRCVARRKSHPAAV